MVEPLAGLDRVFADRLADAEIRAMMLPVGWRRWRIGWGRRRVTAPGVTRGHYLAGNRQAAERAAR